MDEPMEPFTPKAEWKRTSLEEVHAKIKLQKSQNLEEVQAKI